MLGGGYVIDTAAAADAGKVFATASFPLNSSTWQVHAQVVAGATLARDLDRHRRGDLRHGRPIAEGIAWPDPAERRVSDSEWPQPTSPSC